VSNATVSQTETPPAGLTEVHINGTKYIDYFSDGTTMSAYPGDPTIDSNLDKPNAPIPTHEGMTWVHTTGQPLYDTPSGDLELGDYAVLPSGFQGPTFSEYNLNGSNSSDELPHGWFSDGDRDARHYNSDTNNDPERSGNHDAVTGLTTFSDQPRRPPSLPPCPSPLFGR
jgi:hypothetical protein